MTANERVPFYPDIEREVVGAVVTYRTKVKVFVNGVWQVLICRRDFIKERELIEQEVEVFLDFVNATKQIGQIARVPKQNNKTEQIMAKSKEFYTTPQKVKIIQAKHMNGYVAGLGYAKNQFSPTEFQKQMCKGSAAWYGGKIGSEWDVLPFNDKFFRVNNNVGCGFFFIAIEDCEVITTT